MFLEDLTNFKAFNALKLRDCRPTEGYLSGLRFKQNLDVMFFSTAM